MAKDALFQIKDRGYYNNLRVHGYTRIVNYGIVFKGKLVVVDSE